MSSLFKFWSFLILKGMRSLATIYFDEKVFFLESRNLTVFSKPKERNRDFSCCLQIPYKWNLNTAKLFGAQKRSQKDPNLTTPGILENSQSKWCEMVCWGWTWLECRAGLHSFHVSKTQRSGEHVKKSWWEDSSTAGKAASEEGL